ncbi:MAG: hypothetical protein ACLPPF_21310 [Rhodomicrobium sp.]
MAFKLISSRTLTEEELDTAPLATSGGLVLNRRQALIGAGGIIAGGALSIGVTSAPVQARTAGEAVADLIKAQFSGAPTLAKIEIPPQTAPAAKIPVVNRTSEPQSGYVQAWHQTPEGETYPDRSPLLTIPPKVAAEIEYICEMSLVIKRFVRRGRYGLHFVTRIERSVQVQYIIRSA